MGPAASHPDPAPLGECVDFAPPSDPGRPTLRGRYVLLRPLSAAADVPALYRSSHAPDGDPSIWTYMFDGPYPREAQMLAAYTAREASADPLFFTALTRPDGRAAGILAYLRCVPAHGVIEIGHIWLGPALRRTAAATEAIYLLARHAFDELGYRRLEWKCDALNAPSRRAAERFGFAFEGVFAQHMVIKGRNRDTAWYAITDARWPPLRAGFEAWLDPGNFDADGAQRRPLRELTGRAAGGRLDGEGSDPAE